MPDVKAEENPLLTSIESVLNDENISLAQYAKRPFLEKIKTEGSEDEREQMPTLSSEDDATGGEEQLQKRTLRNSATLLSIKRQCLKSDEDSMQNCMPHKVEQSSELFYTVQLSDEELMKDVEYRKSCKEFLQPYPCFKLAAPTMARCRECQRCVETPSSVYCRFYEFRRLRYTEDGDLLVAGFPNPYVDAQPEDYVVWQPNDETATTARNLDVQVCRYILLHVGDLFCHMWKSEAEAIAMHENPNDTIAWKKAVMGTREICDVCATTLFNYHWTCDKCGFGVCIDCVRARKFERSKRKILLNASEAAATDRDEYNWLLCSNNTQEQSSHEFGKLVLTQIIPGDALSILGRFLHKMRTIFKIPSFCKCNLAEYAIKPNKQLSQIVDDLIMEASEKSGLANYGRIVAGEDPISHAFDGIKFLNGLPRYLPTRTMTSVVSKQLTPDVQHEWLCHGKLLRLIEPKNPNNRILFQEVWKCGQPIVISNVQTCLDLSLWEPQAFCRDFGDKPNDLINCLTGNLVPNQPMRHFWEGFECMSKRLRGSDGQPMLLKLKDWPPGDDFAEILPTRYADLMKGLPMPEYTLRTGCLNLANCLPKMFVPPDLGPKMYNAYGSALHPDKGTTNLHLDISDAVNIMVYVGIPDDSNKAALEAATHQAIVMGGSDFFTRIRSIEPDVRPGALWHIYPARDADKIRDLLNRVTIERGYRLEPDHDPIHDQNWYLDEELRSRLQNEYGVTAYTIVQCLGDAVFIPAGAPHQVQNLYNCIKVAEDFVSPENITHCYQLTQQFRNLSHSHTNHEDKLQIKNIVFHAIKDCCTILERAGLEVLKAQCEQLRIRAANLCANLDNND